MTTARIYRPDKTAMQSGKAKMKKWKLEFAPEKPQFVEGLMGWTGMTDMPQQIHLFFPTEEAAIGYAEREGIPYEVVEPKVRSQVKKAYADNFKYKKTSG